MRKLLFLLTLGAFAACNNASTPTSKNDDTLKKGPAAPMDSAAAEFKMSIIDGCVEQNRLALGEAKAYSFCKCMYEQTKVLFPDMDSTKIATLDTAAIARMAANCR